MPIIQEIVEAIDKLTLAEVLELKIELKNRFGIVDALAPSYFPAGYEGPVIEEQTEFTVTLVRAGDTKINVIKTIREILELDLKSAKDFVDAAPRVVKEYLTKDEADKLYERLSKVGATVTIT